VSYFTVAGLVHWRGIEPLRAGTNMESGVASRISRRSHAPRCQRRSNSRPPTRLSSKLSRS